MHTQRSTSKRSPSASSRTKSTHKRTATPHHNNARKISYSNRAKIVNTKKRLVLETPVEPQVKEVSSINKQTEFGVDTTAVAFTHALPNVNNINTPLLQKPALDNAKQMFAVIDINGAQHKVTVDDQVMVNHLRGVEVGEQLAFDHVYLLGGRDFTLLGKPWVPSTSVIATVEEHTLLAPDTVWRYKRRTGYRNLNRNRDLVTILRIDDIQLTDNSIIPDVTPLENVQLQTMKPPTDFTV